MSHTAAYAAPKAKFNALLAKGIGHRAAGEQVGVGRHTAVNWAKEAGIVMTPRSPYPASSTVSKAPSTKASQAKPATKTKSNAPEEKPPHEYFRTPKRVEVNRAASNMKTMPFPHHARRLVLVNAINATPANYEFLSALKTFCRVTDAELVVQPSRYKNPTSVYEGENDDWWDAELAPFICNERATWNGWTYIGDFSVQPTASNPLSGFDVVTGANNCIIGHPQVALTTVPTLPGKPAKVVSTTGAITIPNYSPTKAGARGEFSHTMAALVLTVDDDGDVFYEHVQATADGSFQHDLTIYYPTGDQESAIVDTVVFGDGHERFMDPRVRKASFVGRDSIIQTLKPLRAVVHDGVDNHAGSHHSRHDFLAQFAKRHYGMDSVAQEHKEAFEFYEGAISPHSEIVWVDSNHSHDHTERFLLETDPRKDPANVEIWCEMTLYALRNAQRTPGGVSTPSLFEFFGHKYMKHPEKSIFLVRNQSLRAGEYELSMHGDLGPNGARGSRKALDRIGTKSIIGHSHSPGITGGVIQVGTSSVYEMEYANGPSSWVHCHAKVYQTGKATLMPIINGKWRPRLVAKRRNRAANDTRYALAA